MFKLVTTVRGGATNAPAVAVRYASVDDAREAAKAAHARPPACGACDDRRRAFTVRRVDGSQLRSRCSVPRRSTVGHLLQFRCRRQSPFSGDARVCARHLGCRVHHGWARRANRRPREWGGRAPVPDSAIVPIVPFTNITGEASDEWVGVGIAATMAADLGLQAVFEHVCLCPPVGISSPPASG